MAANLPLSSRRRRSLFLLLALILILTLTLTSLLSSPRSPSSNLSSLTSSSSPPCGCLASDLTNGHWSNATTPRQPLYGATCPFHRNAWNCLRNGRAHMDAINSWSWVPDRCAGDPVPRIDPVRFLKAMRGKKIGFVGDSLNENFLTALLCVLWSGDETARKWKRKGAWRGGYFPKFDLIVGYHRAVLLANYTWMPVEKLDQYPKDEIKGIYRVDVDVAADDWNRITKFYDVLIFNTGHWWGPDKFPKEKPLVFFREGKPINPPLGIHDGLNVVISSMVSYIEKEVPGKTLKLWRTQSPRHFFGGEWDQNGSCLFNEPLKEHELDSWFDSKNKGINREAREVNEIIREAILGTSIELFNLTHLSEFRADAHPGIWLGKKDAVSVWGQDCLHWCLPGLPDTWVDLLTARILNVFGR
ncbi:hypothetical protein LUZ63_017271 [Rhynchospora breviuscula]|uniref:Trichome birefringence-like N-terminal domain-containing protein n=1 Tax=Rhynchospora breviuscula TaxID=2022672 RepID=A0A9Q0C258_9POAL|nr:hypothetical protein LUZ63_017271 [Rhynchospora breviuscula]